jgi:hypothetical protein
MAFWNDQAVEPKRKFRWLLSVTPEVGNADAKIPYWTIKKVNRPSYEIAEAEHKFINHTFYFPGRVTYNTVSFTIVDTANPDAAETLKQILYASGYALPKDDRTSTQSITKNAAVKSLGIVTIELIGGGGVNTQPNQRPGEGEFGASEPPAGKVLERWILHNAWVKKIEFSELDYEGDELTEINVELRYDYAELNKDNEVGPIFGTLDGITPASTVPKRSDN